VGVQRAVPVANDGPAFAAVAAKLAEGGEPAVVRMIDGQPAFPDEVPEAGWREVRLSFPAGMVTVRRGPGEWTCVVWGTDDPALIAARDRVCDAIAAAGGGDADR
jgi:hypothetical protein